eukprot:m51a1_g9351 hypothetical protein (641) ;mRNA; r:119676-122045
MSEGHRDKMRRRSLKDLLAREDMDVDTPSPSPAPAPATTEPSSSAVAMCSECEDQPAAYTCAACADAFCSLCFTTQHRKGARATHVAVPVERATPEPDEDAAEDDGDAAEAGQTRPKKRSGVSRLFSTIVGSGNEEEAADERPRAQDTVYERAKYIPMRLTMEERKLLRLLEATLNVTNYTDCVDAHFQKKGQRTHEQLKAMCAVLSALVAASDSRAGVEVANSREFGPHADYLRTVFEIGRRHKIINPDKMRTTYAKLVYILQDSLLPQITEMFGFSLVAPLQTVYLYLEQRGATALLRDELIETATQVINAPSGKSRYLIDREIKAKERAIEKLAHSYSTDRLSKDEVRRCLYSVSDNNCFLLFNRDPIDKMIDMLREQFPLDGPAPAAGGVNGVDQGDSETEPEREERAGGLVSSLAIEDGRDGARLTHTHERQYYYVLQSLTLWREIQHNMYRLWFLAEQDMLRAGSVYTLKDTGQGLHRVQAAPQVYRAMQSILDETQRRIGGVAGWVGSSVIHLGDHNVPNALLFIDKYTQVPRILTPIALTVERMETMCGGNKYAKLYVERRFGSHARASHMILSDFFRHAFDGSGADNFFDAGSCIDGRLTSAWNWCNTLNTKPFFYIFLLAGFVGFDGEWK